MPNSALALKRFAPSLCAGSRTRARAAGRQSPPFAVVTCSIDDVKVLSARPWWHIENFIAIAALLLITGFVTLPILGAFVLFAYWHSPTRGLPYHDSFPAGKAGEWQAFGGTWEVKQGSMQDGSNERGARLLTGSPYWQNYSIEGDVMLLSFSGYASDAGFIVRSSDEEEGVYAYNSYFVTLDTVRGLGSSLALGRTGHGVGAVSSPLKTSVQASTWYHLKLLAYRCRLIATASLPSAETPTMVSITDEDCLRNGRVGLQSSHSGGVWRNVVVRPATQGDFDKMLAQGPSHEFSPLAGLPVEGSPLAPPPTNQTHVLPFSPNALPIGSLRLASLAKPARVTISGQVILTSPALFVQDSIQRFKDRGPEGSGMRFGLQKVRYIPTKLQAGVM